MKGINMTFPSWMKPHHLKELIKQRYVVAIMMLLACINMYTMRVCLSVAIVKMTSPEEELVKWSPDSTCSDDFDNTTDPNFLPLPTPPELSWSEQTRGLVLSAFFWGYVPSHIFAPVVTNFLGGKYSLGLSLVMDSFSALLTPLATRLGGYQWVIALRVISGAGEGMSFPAMSVILSHWIPPEERSTAVTFVFTGAQLGTVIGTAFTGILLNSFDWPITFYFYGLCGLVWCLLWLVLCYSTPSEHPFISETEHKYIAESIRPNKKVRRVPVKAILTSLPVWGLMLGQVGHDWTFFTLITDLPSYMSYVLHYSIRSNGLLSALPYLIMWICSNLFAVLADWLIAKNKISTLQVRRIFTLTASFGPAIGVVAASYAGCDRTLVVTFLCLGMATMGAFYPGLRSNAFDITKNYSATVMALSNGFGALSGIASPYITGLITADNTVAEWRTVFWITAVVMVSTNIVYAFFAKATYQPWDIQDEEEAYKADISIEAMALPDEEYTYNL